MNKDKTLFEIDGFPHTAGDLDCDACWRGYPVRCECGGLIHAEFGEQLTHDSYSLHYKCDLCHSEDDPCIY